MLRSLLLRAAGCAAVLASTTFAHAATLRVPSQYPTIQAAVDAAQDGDLVRVARGKYCGATLTKRVQLVGHGKPRIIGCGEGPVLSNGARIGFYLPGVKGVNPASGSEIRGFVFDGAGVGNADLSPLSLGVFARFANDIVVAKNTFKGTTQAITNTAGDGWLIERNRIRNLRLFDCTRLCSGGDGIVIQLASGSLAAAGGSAAAINRPENNHVLDNQIQGSPPDGFATFSMAGILLLSADHTTLLSNRVRLRDNPAASAVGQGVLVTNTCCGSTTGSLPGSRWTTLAYNDGRQSEVAIVVEGTGGANTQRLLLRHNRGSVQIEGSEPLLLTARVARGPVRAQPQM